MRPPACDDAAVTPPTSPSAASRTVAVPAARLATWVGGFVARHGDAQARRSAAGWVLEGADGARAVLRAPFGPTAVPASRSGGESATEDASPLGVWPAAALDALVAGIVAEVSAPPPCAVLVVRRGGYLAAVVRDGQVVVSKLGRRHVQGRTAAGGWSQQRFARRRGKQTDELVDAAVETAVRVLGPHLPLAGLATGGDRPLVAAVLGEPRLHALHEATVTASLSVGTPDRDTVAALPQLLSTLSVVVTDAPSTTP